jgi:hypothetical protein
MFLSGWVSSQLDGSQITQPVAFFVVLTSSRRTTPPELDSYFCLAIDPLEPLFCVMCTTVILKNTEDHGNNKKFLEEDTGT